MPFLMVIFDFFYGVIVQLILVWALYLKVDHPKLAILLMLLVGCFAINDRYHNGSYGY